MTVRWRGQTADYTTAERLLMADLPVREQAFVHLLKSLAGGEIGEHVPEGNGLYVAPHGDQSGVSPSTAVMSPETRDLQANVGVILDRQEPLNVYTNPEDLEFGEKPKRRQKIYAVAWTWRKHKIHKTKKRCEQRLKVWKRWYERQGWTVRRMGTGYWADGPGGEKHVISLHEYDRDTKERLS